MPLTRCFILALFVYVLPLVLVPTGLQAADTDGRLAAETHLLEEELGLAEKPSVYLVFDLPGKNILFKARGIVLRTLPIREIRHWGRPFSPDAYELEQREAENAPERKVIVPGSTESHTLELKDMPISYNLRMAGDLVIEIGSLPGEGEKFPRLARAWEKLCWYATQPILTLRRHHRKESVITLRLTLEPEDAQALYWSFTEGTSAIVIPAG